MNHDYADAVILIHFGGDFMHLRQALRIDSIRNRRPMHGYYGYPPVFG
jgi:hypothetical protein